MSASPSQAEFADAVGSRFAVAGDPQVELELTELQPGFDRPGFEHFSLLFRGPAAVLLPQATRALANERLGEVDIFLVPIGADADGTYYEAVFDRRTIDPD
jgi:hypothetical protein